MLHGRIKFIVIESISMPAKYGAKYNFYVFRTARITRVPKGGAIYRLRRPCHATVTDVRTCPPVWWGDDVDIPRTFVSRTKRGKTTVVIKRHRSPSVRGKGKFGIGPLARGHPHFGPPVLPRDTLRTSDRHANFLSGVSGADHYVPVRTATGGLADVSPPRILKSEIPNRTDALYTVVNV